MDSPQLLDVIGGLVSHLRGYAAKLPAVVHLAAIPSGIKPTLESVDAYENIVSRFRHQSAGTPYRTLHELFLESLEAFETGNLLGSVQPLLAVLDHVERMRRDNEITVGPTEEKRLGEYRTALHKILPGNRPELEGAGRGM